MSSTNRKQLSEFIKREIAFKQKYLCNICGLILPPAYQFDHIIPHSISYNDDIDNIQALCNNCHGTKTLRENERIIKFKKYCKENQRKIKDTCWFCLENCKKKCKRILKPVVFKTKNVRTNEEFELMCNDFSYMKVEDNDILKVELCFYNLCIYVNNIVYKSSKGDLALEDVSEAIDLATRSKKFSKKYTTLHIKSLFNWEPDKNELNEYFDFLSENILEHINERLFKDINNVRLILD